MILHPFLKSAVRRLVGDRWYLPTRSAYIYFRGIEFLFKDARWRESWKRLQQFENKHEGQRCFIIGNGPSLNRTDLSLLQDEYTFGMNRIYLLFDKLNASTSYYVTVNRYVISQFADDISSIPCPKFISWRSRDFINFDRGLIFINTDRGEPSFSCDLTNGIWEGCTVTYVAMQLAFFMGFQRVILIGVDHYFHTTGTPHTAVTSEGDDPNHFDSRYFGKGVKWQLPDLETSELAYRIAKFKYEASGREIVDATIDGNLDVFEKIEYVSLFN